MPISTIQLATWAKQGSITNSKATADSVKFAIDSYTKFSSNVHFDVYLQGSYRNDTNIFGESDVDVVVQLSSGFYSNLSQEDKNRFSFTSSNYGFSTFRQEVLFCLTEYYGSDIVKPDNKVIRVFPKSNRLHADVLVCFDYRLYYNTIAESLYHPGLSFFTQNEGNQIINFPKQHSEGGTEKHQESNGNFKPIVRIFKNIRKTLIERGDIEKTKAPSYFIECFLGNLPSLLYTANYDRSMFLLLQYVTTNSWDGYMCLNGITGLWGNSSEYWNQNDARLFFQSVINLWNN